MKGKKLLLFPALILGASSLSGCSLLCSVTWLDWDDTVLEQDLHVFPLEFAKYDGKTPTREATAQYTFKFDHWNETPKRVLHKNTVFKAVYESTIRSYEVTWRDSNGAILRKDTLNYGETPSFDYSKESDAQYDYEFKGWDKPVTPVTGNVTYTAQVNNKIKSYKVDFVNWDGEVLQSKLIEYGKIPQYSASAPVREDNPEFVYTFKGWDKPIQKVTKDTTYTATFDVRDALYFNLEYYIWNGVAFVPQQGSDFETYVREQSDVTLPSLLVDEENDFCGHDIKWYLSSSFEKEVTEAKDVLDNIKFYGEDNGLHQFDVKYNLDGGTLENANPEKVTYEDDVILNLPVKDGYDDEEAIWLDNERNKVSELAHTLANIELTADYTPNTYCISFAESEHFVEQLQPKEIKFGEEINLSDRQPITKPGYKFKGWKAPNAENYFEGKYELLDDVELIPDIESLTYAITYVYGDAVMPEQYATSYTLDTLNIELPAPTKSGYTLAEKAWKAINLTGSPSITSLTDIEETLIARPTALTLQAQFSANSYEVSFDFAGGNKVYNVSFLDKDAKSIQEESVAYSVNEVSYPVLDDIEGYQFAGWEMLDEAISGDIKVQSKWNAIAENAISVKIGEDNIVELHNLNSKVCQFTSLVDQKLKISSQGEVDLLMSSEDMGEHGIDQDNLNYWFELNAEAGKSYLIEVRGATNTDGSTNVKIDRTEEGSIYPEEKITAKECTSINPISFKFDKAMNGLPIVAKAGYNFVGWFDGETQISEGDTLKKAEAFTLAAHWEASMK